MEIQQSSPSGAASYLCVSVVVLLTGAHGDPRSTQPCPPIWACLCGADQWSAWCLSAPRKRGDQGSESPPDLAAPSSASPCVSRSPRSFQPAPQQLQSQGASVRGGGDGKGLENWSGHGTASRAPPPPPTCLTAASGHATAGASARLPFSPCSIVWVCVCAFCACLLVSADSTLRCAWMLSLFSHC